MSAVRDLVSRHPDRARAVALDGTDPRAAESAVRVAAEEFGRFDVLVNNAGYANVSAGDATTWTDERRQALATSVAALTGRQP